MTVMAMFRCNEVSLFGSSTRVRLSAVYTQDTNDPHYDEIKSFNEATPQGTFEATIKNDAAAEHFQPGEMYYLAITRVKAKDVA